MMLVTHLIGPKRRSDKKFYPYESGMDLLDEARKKINVKFYLVATLFILLDIETVFLIPWAVVYQKVGIIGVVDMVIFLFLVALAILYIIKKGALNWEEY